jgi:hypothetical protein
MAGAVAALLVLTAPWMPPLCPTRLLLHVPCPSCGLTRAAGCLLRADLAGATRMHPLWVLVFPYLGAVLGLEAARYLKTGAFGGVLAQPLVQRVGVVLLIALVVVWLARWLGAFGGPVPVE